MSCQVVDCDRQVIARSLCSRHYRQWKKHGEATQFVRPPRDLTVEEHLRWHGWTVTDSGCWEWNGPRRRKEAGRDYGRLQRGGVAQPVHRLAYETWVGPIPEGHVVRHRCDNAPCMNPDHLETGTLAENSQDRDRRGRRVFPAGELNGRSKLTWTQVEDIRWLLGMGASESDIRTVFQMSSSAINNIKNYRRWNHREAGRNK